MAHYRRLSKIVIDVLPADHDRELVFWSAATGQPLARFGRHPEYHGAALPGQELWLLIQRLGDGPGRVHIDIHTDDPAAEMTRLEKLGAELVQQVHSWWVMRDPCRTAVLPHSGKARKTVEVLFRPRRGSHPEFIAGLPGRMTADAETIDWWERATPRRQ